MTIGGNVVLWVRHAQSLGNVERRLSHRSYDPPLTSLGMTQAAALGHALGARGDLGGRPVLCSPSLRTQQTADHVIRSIGDGQRIVDERLREIDCGDLDGHSEQQARETVDRLKERWALGDLDAPYPGGESLRDVLTRMYAVLKSAAALSMGGPVVLVGHGGSLGLYASQLLAPHERNGFVRLANASVSEVSLTVRSGVLLVSVLTWNGTGHLATRSD